MIYLKVLRITKTIQAYFTSIKKSSNATAILNPFNTVAIKIIISIGVKSTEAITSIREMLRSELIRTEIISWCPFIVITKFY